MNRSLFGKSRAVRPAVLLAVVLIAGCGGGIGTCKDTGYNVPYAVTTPTPPPTTMRLVSANITFSNGRDGFTASTLPLKLLAPGEPNRCAADTYLQTGSLTVSQSETETTPLPDVCFDAPVAPPQPGEYSSRQLSVYSSAWNTDNFLKDGVRGDAGTAANDAAFIVGYASLPRQPQGTSAPFTEYFNSISGIVSVTQTTGNQFRVVLKNVRLVRVNTSPYYAEPLQSPPPSPTPSPLDAPSVLVNGELIVQTIGSL